MRKKLKVAFLWHMHQPCYKNIYTNEYQLPWVRLHGIKSYYDMGKIVEEVEGARVTFNFVPSLLEQLNDYAEGIGTDIYLEHTIKDPDALTAEEKCFILSNFFHAHPDHMIRPYPRYAALADLRGDGAHIPERIRDWSSQDFMDLQVWFNLTWFGQTVKDQDPEIMDLIKKNCGFTQKDKERVLAKQREIIKKIVPLYRALSDTGRVELTTSPFYHPILPLLCDNQEMLNSMPGAARTQTGFSFPEDADKQIRAALAYHEATFGRRPRGIWPSEGAVSDAALQLISRNGLIWTASDENIIAHTLQGDSRLQPGRAFLSQPYSWEAEGGQLAVFFRDHLISDLIGFVYHRWFTPDAVGDFLNRLATLHQELPEDRSNIVCIILDGENAWEYYYRQGYDFLTGIYRGIAEHPDMEMVTFSEYLWRFPMEEKIRHIYPGSWINADFQTWIGQKVKNQAWDYLAQTRLDLERLSAEEPNEEKREKAWQEMMIAEGSDWFWWFGDTHSSALDAEFDGLFRTHLKNVYQELDQKPPIYLEYPLTGEMDEFGLEKPEISEHNKGSGSVYFREGAGAMQRSNYLVDQLYYAFSPNRLVLRLDGAGCTWLLGENKELNDTYGKQGQMEIQLKNGAANRIMVVPDPIAGAKVLFIAENNHLITESYPRNLHPGTLELEVPFAAFGLQENQEFSLQIILRNENGELERCPAQNQLNLQIPRFDE